LKSAIELQHKVSVFGESSRRHEQSIETRGRQSEFLFLVCVAAVLLKNGGGV